jgi:hypothetical protein
MDLHDLCRFGRRGVYDFQFRYRVELSGLFNRPPGLLPGVYSLNQPGPRAGQRTNWRRRPNAARVRKRGVVKLFAEDGDRHRATIHITPAELRRVPRLAAELAEDVAAELAAGVSCVLIDLVGVGRPIHDAVWQTLTGQPSELPPAASPVAFYSADAPGSSVERPAGVGLPVPDLLITLSGGAAVVLPLADLYWLTFTRTVPRFRRLVETDAADVPSIVGNRIPPPDA